MKAKLHLQFGQPHFGWLPVQIESNSQKLSFNASHTPWDSFLELTTALITSASTQVSKTVVHWNTEPTEYEFHFLSDLDETEFAIEMFPDGRRRNTGTTIVFRERGSRAEVILPFWRALRNLESRSPFQDREQWQYPFPSEELAKLTDQVALLKH